MAKDLPKIDAEAQGEIEASMASSRSAAQLGAGYLTALAIICYISDALWLGVLAILVATIFSLPVLSALLSVRGILKPKTSL